MNIEDIRKALEDRRLDRVAEATGIHRNTLGAIRSGQNVNPSWRTVKTLAEYLRLDAG